MLRRDYVLKLIEQFAKMVGRLLDVDFDNEPVLFCDDFDLLLKEYFKIHPDHLDLLLTKDEARDALLLSENSKNSQLSLFARAGWVFAKNNDFHRAKICLKIIERIKRHHADLFEFPNAESRQT
ncbi:MAG: hypothetical protein PHO74_09250, partial [Weeksellaceae bacterium]|nr:hypothetical protein [Weeksellaceae bacterium]